jgi:hypothetical protein
MRGDFSARSLGAMGESVARLARDPFFDRPPILCASWPSTSSPPRIVPSQPKAARVRYRSDSRPDGKVIAIAVDGAYHDFEQRCAALAEQLGPRRDGVFLIDPGCCCRAPAKTSPPRFSEKGVEVEHRDGLLRLNAAAWASSVAPLSLEESWSIIRALCRRINWSTESIALVPVCSRCQWPPVAAAWRINALSRIEAPLLGLGADITTDAAALMGAS